jgi:exodeoxyribonuclease-1
MAASFFFYDLETSGFDPRAERIMQFAGQRTDLELNPVGEPVNVLIKLGPDVLPSPDAILLTGITPQQTIAEGITEAEFLKLFYDEVVKPGTIFVGFNSIRFDDEFMRFLHYRNFYDAYEWHWADSCSRWDLLDVVRMTRALRPEGIEWPFAPDGKPANRLEYLTSVNKLNHDHAHDALSDVRATIAVAQLIHNKQNDLFEYLLGMRDKKKTCELVQSGQPFVYASGKYPSQYLHTTVAVKLADHPQSGCDLVYDLRHDPTPFINMSTDELVAAWRYNKDPEAVRLPVKTIKYNRCPAVSPVGVIKDQATQDRIGLNLNTISKNLALLKKDKSFAKRVVEALQKLEDERAATQTSLMPDAADADGKLYDGFLDNADKQAMRAVRAADPDELSQLADEFKDDRLKAMLPLYKARNYPSHLTDEERAAWEEFIKRRLFEGGDKSKLAKYFARLAELAQGKLTSGQQFLLEELQLYGQSIMPSDAQ